MLSSILNDFKDALVSGCSGLSRPANLQAGGAWIDTTNETAPNYYWSFKVWTGSTNIEIFRININSGFGGALTTDSTFQRQQISADTAGAIIEFIKQRLSNNGQVLDADSVAEIRFVGRTDTSTDPTVAYFKWVSSDDEVAATASGGTFSFYSVADASSTITEHLKFISGQVETVVPLKLNSLILAQQSVATVTDITSLSASIKLVELTGATTTNIHGIDAAANTQEITIHNRSSAVVTLKHLSTSASAANRLQLPSSKDVTLRADETVNLYYCSTDTKWKLVANKIKGLTRYKDDLRGTYNTWTAPTGCTRVRVTAYTYRQRMFWSGFLDSYGNAYAMGRNSNGDVGDGTVTLRSSPVAVIGGLQFIELSSSGFAEAGTTPLSAVKTALASSGQAYEWGSTTGNGLRSSPVAVLGTVKFSRLHGGHFFTIGLDQSGKAYGWGSNTNGELGNGATAFQSSPVAVLGGLTFSKVSVYGLMSTVRGSICGITPSGVAYAWGYNGNGNLGVGDITPRSSPVAILGGISFSKVILSQNTSIGLSSSGAAYCWGSNGTSGSVGNGTTTNSYSSPVAVIGGLTFIDVGGISGSRWGLTSNGSLYTWGSNTSGTLGVGDTTNRSSPVAVIGGLKFDRVFSGTSAMWGLTLDGTLYAWGRNTNGELGVGDTVNRSSPVAVLGGLKWIDLYSNANSMYGVTTDGLVYAWGLNDNGELGLGDTVPRSSPVAVLSSLGVDGRSMAYLPITKNIEITVAPGTTYTVLLTDFNSSFGNVSLGGPVDRVTVEYELQGA
jgi:alpha-tubulin suppressor-like RCC1 family protein